MEFLYKIIGIQAIGNRICLKIIHVEEKKEYNTGKMLSDIGGFIDKIKTDAASSKQQDQISIPIETYQQKNYRLGDMITINVNDGDEN